MARRQRGVVGLVLTAFVALGMPVSGASTPGAAMDQTWFGNLSQSAQQEVDKKAPVTSSPADPAASVERYGGEIDGPGHQVLVMDFAHRASGDFVVEGRIIDLTTGTVLRLAAQSRGRSAPVSSGTSASNGTDEAEDGTRVCTTRTTTTVPGQAECYERIAIARIVQIAICANPVSRIPPVGTNGCSLAGDFVDNAEDRCDDLPQQVETIEVCYTVPEEPDTGQGKVDDQKDTTKQDAKDEYCKHRRPCEVS